jgi:hypothetical protein
VVTVLRLAYTVEGSSEITFSSLFSESFSLMIFGVNSTLCDLTGVALGVELGVTIALPLSFSTDCNLL